MGVHDKEVYKDVKLLLDIPEDEPIFIIRAQDVVAIPTLMDYSLSAESANVSVAFIGEMHKVVAEFEDWKKRHGDKMKVPD